MDSFHSSSVPGAKKVRLGIYFLVRSPFLYQSRVRVRGASNLALCAWVHIHGDTHTATALAPEAKLGWPQQCPDLCLPGCGPGLPERSFQFLTCSLWAPLWAQNCPSLQMTPCCHTQDASDLCLLQPETMMDTYLRENSLARYRGCCEAGRG